MWKDVQEAGEALIPPGFGEAEGATRPLTSINKANVDKNMKSVVMVVSPVDSKH